MRVLSSGKCIEVVGYALSHKTVKNFPSALIWYLPGLGCERDVETSKGEQKTDRQTDGQDRRFVLIIRRDMDEKVMMKLCAREGNQVT